MIILESILLWVLAGLALMLILQYVMKSPQSHQRPEIGLGKRFSVGGLRRVRTASVERIARPEPSSPAMPVQAFAPEQESFAPEEIDMVAAAVDPILVEGPQSENKPLRRKKRTDTMQLMLNKAIAERR